MGLRVFTYSELMPQLWSQERKREYFYSTAGRHPGRPFIDRSPHETHQITPTTITGNLALPKCSDLSTATHEVFTRARTCGT